MTIEEWRPVMGFEGLYEVSNLGRVKSLPKHRKSIVYLKPYLVRYKPTGRITATRVALWKKNKMTGRAIHRIVLEAFIGLCPKGMEGCHDDGNPENNKIGNLQWDTKEKNGQDLQRHGTVKGSRNSQAKLDEKKVIEIKKKLLQGNNQYRIAEQYDVTQSTISLIATNKKWQHVCAS